MKKITLLFWVMMGISFYVTAGFTPTAGPQGGATARAFLKDGNSVYSCVGGYLYKTTDNGSTWNKVYVAADVSDFYGIVKSGNNLVTTCNNGKYRIYRSSDYGATWTASSTGMPQVSGFDLYVPIQLMTMKDTIFITTTTAGVYKSSDNGVTWMPTGQASGVINAICSSGDTLFIGGATIKPSYSTDMGKTFTAATGDLVVLSGNKFNQVIRMAFHNGRWFAGTAYIYGMLYSDDMGATWQKPNLYPNSCDFVAVAGKKLWAGGSGSKKLYSSDDWGATLNYESMDGADYEIQAIYDDGSLVWIGTLYNGIFNASDARGKSTWMSKNNGLNFQNVKKMITSGSTLFALCNGKIYQTSDNGSTWANKDTGIWQYIQFIGSDLMACKSDGLYKSSDNGLTWSAVSSMSGKNVQVVGGTSSWMLAVVKASEPELYISTDGGNTWSKKTVGGTNIFWTTYSALDIHNFGTGKYVVAMSGGHVITTDAGGTFTWSNPLNASGVYSSLGNRLLVHKSGDLQVSDNDGKTWRKFANGIPGFFLQVGGLFTHNNTAYIYNGDAGGTVGLYSLASTDTVWKSVANTGGLPVLPTVAMAGIGTKIFISPAGQSVWSVDLQGGGSSAVDVKGSDKESLCFPNPVEKGQVLHLGQNIQTGAIISIYSIEGQLRYRERYQGNGISTQDFTQGVYLLQIENQKAQRILVQ